MAYRFVNTEIFIKKALHIHGGEYDYSETFYKMSKDPIDIICKKHGKFQQLAKNHIKGHGCFLCYGSHVRRLNTEQFIEKSIKIHGVKFDYTNTIYESRYKKVEIICKKHGPFLTTPANHTLAKAGCPRCLNSKGENLIISILNKMSINFITQYRFDECKHLKQLRFDFFIPSINKCIEFDGQQHFSSKWLGEDSFKQIVLNDSIKDDFCKSNSIPLLRIKFNDKNIEEKIIIFINGK